MLFLVKKSEGRIAEICLAMKKEGFGVGRWNGSGGKVKGIESLEETVVRETQEEILVTPSGLIKVALFDFHFPHRPEIDMRVHTYLSESWTGEIGESEEMAPRWFKVEEIPYAQMWPGDHFWIPLMLEGKRLQGRFEFGQGDCVLSKEINEVEKVAG